ncbi:hypothetical protein DFH08DRAFT_1089677 [Mycena albidolilacea]|uniref:Uncharacterized protein n=1 Tax=Mycena albidolilacea TaxID=1033008 RepID=A0AAD6Z054_9AGAR|nr:hypothetical protein DFH08DRAFT_1089677 [Mycena albidolilacea]
MSCRHSVCLVTISVEHGEAQTKSQTEMALLKIDELADSAARGVPLVLTSQLYTPQPGQLPIHQDALGRLNASIAFKSSDHDSLDTARLLFTKLVAEASTGSTPSPNEEISAAPFLPAIMGTLPSLVVFTHTAPFPASPSHPAAPAILSIFKAAQKGYADMRGIWSRKCLETQGKRFIDRADTSLLSVADEEYKCIKDLSPLSTPNVVVSPSNALLNPILFLFSTTLTSLIALIKRSLKYSTPPLRSPRTRRCLHCSRAGTPFTTPDSRNFNANERKTGRARCGRSSPEFLADIEMALLVKNVSGTESSVGVVECCQVHGPPAGEDGRRVTVGKNSKLNDGDEQLILEYFIYDVTMAISSLTASSRTGRCTCETTSSSPRPGHTLATKFDTTSFTTSSPIAIRASTSPSSSPEAAAAAQRVLHALREEVVEQRLVVLLSSAVLETSSLYRASEIYQAIEPAAPLVDLVPLSSILGVSWQ